MAKKVQGKKRKGRDIVLPVVALDTPKDWTPVRLLLPGEVVDHLSRVANQAGVTLEQAINVVLALGFTERKSAVNCNREA